MRGSYRPYTGQDFINLARRVQDDATGRSQPSPQLASMVQGVLGPDSDLSPSEILLQAHSEGVSVSQLDDLARGFGADSGISFADMDDLDADASGDDADTDEPNAEGGEPTGGGEPDGSAAAAKESVKELAGEKAATAVESEDPAKAKAAVEKATAAAKVIGKAAPASQKATETEQETTSLGRWGG